MNLKNILIFGFGFLTGALCAAKYIEKTWGDLEEVESNEEDSEDSDDEMTEPYEEQRENISKGLRDVENYKKTVDKSGYVDYSSVNKPERTEVKECEIEVIAPEDYGAIDDYDQIDLTLYSDDVLADDQLDLIDDLEQKIGDALKDFGKYEDDALHVRNDTYKAYYEILRDLRTYEEACEQYHK